MWEFQLMICSSITSYTVTESYWAKGSIGWLDLGGVMTPLITPILVFVNVFVCLFACVFVRMFVCCVFNVVILNVFVFPIYSMLKWQNEIIINFVDGHPSSLNLMTFCQALHGDYWPPCSFFHFIKINLRHFLYLHKWLLAFKTCTEFSLRFITYNFLFMIF